MAHTRRLASTTALLALAVGAVYAAFGGGQPFPDRSLAPLLPPEALERVLSHPEPVGNVAVAADGQVFFTAHPEGRPLGPKLLVGRDGVGVPWPDEATQATLNTPLGLRVDAQGRLWVIDHGLHGTRPARLFVWEVATGALLAEHVLPREVAPIGSFLQDLAVTPDGATALLADLSALPRRPAVVVFDVATGTSRRVLERHPALMPQDWRVRTPRAELVFLGGLFTLKLGLDGIGVSRDGQAVVLAAMAHDTAYTVPLAAVLDPRQSTEALGAQVRALGPKPQSDGLTTDAAGNVLLTDVEHQAIARLSPEGRLETLLRSEALRWPDGLSFGPEGWLYIADSGLDQVMLRSRATIAEGAPYSIWRFRPGAPAPAGQ